jgi:hypothetical protein
MGMAADVCVNPTLPADCPSGAVIYKTSGGSGWTANTSAYPSARWIWRGDVTPTADADLVFAVFQASFDLGPNPTGAINLAADDYAEVLVNGSVAGSVGSVTNETTAGNGQDEFPSFSLTPYLVQGTNTITIVGQNGPNTYVNGGNTCSPCTYANNTAGVVFGGTLTYASPAANTGTNSNPPPQ